MVFNNSLPCVRERSESLESDWLNPSDFGECLNQPSDSQLYPCLTPVYNGKVLNIQPELIHASLSGISIKHYYGKCQQESEDEEFWGNEETELYGNDFFYPEQKLWSEPANDKSKGTFSDSSTSEKESLEFYENSFTNSEFTQPICTIPKINFRNSFWNIHRPELCKLTWSRKYVSTATVTEYLHDHLKFHGPLCADYHEEFDRINMLNKELDDYVRLKEILSPREIPPDEKFINFKMIEKQYTGPKCRNIRAPEKAVINYKDRNLNLSDDEEMEGKNVHLSKEEFCLTIGKYIRKIPKTMLVPNEKENLLTPGDLSGGEEGEGCDIFYYNWHLYGAEQSYEQRSDESTTERDDESGLVPLFEPCPPITMNDFCRAAGKADFSDLRCNPDDF